MEVVYTGIFQTPASIVRTVLQEDADVLGISSLSGAHMEYTTEILDQLRQEGLDDVTVVVGGTIPTSDVARLRELGVAGVFGPGTPTAKVVEFIQNRSGRVRTSVPDGRP
jgi:methylmalonyl-CoA mutase C-terminal domain/subunit